MLSYRTCSDIIKRHILCFLLYISRFVLWQHGFAQFFKNEKETSYYITNYIFDYLIDDNDLQALERQLSFHGWNTQSYLI